MIELINAYRVRGHLIADIDPLHAMPVLYHPELDIETYGLTIWDLDREFITGGLAGTEVATLREILDILQRAYCGKVGIEYRHIQSKEEKLWIREQIRREFVNPEPIPVEIKKQLLVETDLGGTVRTLSAHEVSRPEAVFARRLRNDHSAARSVD